MKLCTDCFRRHWRAKINQKTGLQVTKNGNLVYVCINCGHEQEESEKTILLKHERIKANVLYIDIEVSKSMFLNYGARVPSKFIHHSNIIKERYIISWAASYIGSTKVFSDCVTPEDAKTWWDFSHPESNADENIIKQLHALMQSTEIIAGHNVNRFDMKHCFARFAYYGLEPIHGKKTIDTLTLARSKFAFEYNGLDYIAQRLGFRPKDNITQDDWKEAIIGNPKTLKRIEKYNRGDVVEGKNVYEFLIKWAGKRSEFGSLIAREGVSTVETLLDRIDELNERLSV